MTDTLKGSITATPYTGTEEAFIPGAVKKIEVELEPIVTPEEPTETVGTKKIEVVLEKIPGEVPPSPWSPPTIEYEPYTFVKPENRPLVVDIETTGLEPWESRIISIGIKDPLDPESEPTILMHEDEKTLVMAFLAHWTAKGFNQLIGYNASFDHRFIFAAAMRYRLVNPSFFDTDIYDVMNVMKQVQDRYVYGFNKPGTLGEWSNYLLGKHKVYGYTEVLKAWADGNLDLIAEHNAQDVELTFQLWTLQQWTLGTLSTLTPEQEKVLTQEQPTEQKKVQCKLCMADIFAEEGVQEVVCDVCGSKNYLP